MKDHPYWQLAGRLLSTVFHLLGNSSVDSSAVGLLIAWVENLRFSWASF